MENRALETKHKAYEAELYSMAKTLGAIYKRLKDNELNTYFQKRLAEIKAKKVNQLKTKNK